MLDSMTRFALQETLLRACEAPERSVVLVTHDVDEALFLRIASS
jgi:ABC-type nitrate/sulfonate/bicarbonate transport system ATPase subunit